MREFYQKDFRRSETCALVDEDRTAGGLFIGKADEVF
jgi:hypothetical protein